MQVVAQIQCEIQGFSDMVRQAEYTAQVIATRVERKAEEITRQVQMEKEQSVREAQTMKVAQEKIAQQLVEAQKVAQSMVVMSQQYEAQLDDVTQKMEMLETLLIAQRQKSSLLESELSATQDHIGGAKRRAQMLEQENSHI